LHLLRLPNQKTPPNHNADKNWHWKSAYRDQESGSVPCTLQLPRDSIVRLGGAKSASRSGSRIASTAALLWWQLLHVKVVMRGSLETRLGSTVKFKPTAAAAAAAAAAVVIS
jgi:hypothetical protein